MYFNILVAFCIPVVLSGLQEEGLGYEVNFIGKTDYTETNNVDLELQSSDSSIVICWIYEKFSFKNDGRIIIEDAYLSFTEDGRVWFHGVFDSNIHGSAYKNTFTLLDANDAIVAIVKIRHHLKCGLEAIKIEASEYRKYSTNQSKWVSWKGWEVEEMINCEE